MRSVFYTDQLRPNDMGIMVHGVPADLIKLEPSPTASVSGTCPESCTQQVLFFACEDSVSINFVWIIFLNVFDNVAFLCVLCVCCVDFFLCVFYTVLLS